MQATTLTANEIKNFPHGAFVIAQCEDTQELALYRKFSANKDGAMSGMELLVHEDGFRALFEELKLCAGKGGF